MPDEQESQGIGYQGLRAGFENVFYGAQYGLGNMTSDLGQLGQIVAPMDYQQQQAPAEYQHHGMTMYTMNTPQALAGAFGAPFGHDIPQSSMDLEYRLMAMDQAGASLSRAAMYGAFYTGTGLATSAAFMAMPLGKWGKKGFQAGKRAMGGGLKMAATGPGKYIYTTARAGSMAARAGAFTESLGIGATAGITAASWGGGLAGIAGSLALPVAATMAADFAIEQVADGARERQEIQDYLMSSSFRYLPLEGRQDALLTGGMSRRQAGRAAESLMRYEEGQFYYDIGDIKSILQKGTQIGLFSGTRDAEDFQKRFRDTADTLKNVAKILHTSLSEGLDTIKAMRDIGITDPKMQLAAINRADITGLASGKTAAEMFTIGLQGAQVFKGTGVSMAAAAQSNQMAFTAIETARQQGLISEEQLAHMGGEEAAAQALTSQTLRFAQTGYGRSLLMAMAPEGKFSPETFRQFLSGEQDIYKVLGGAAQNMANPLTRMKFQANQEKIMGDLMGEAGGFGAMLLPAAGALRVAQQQMQAFGIPQTRENTELAMKFVMRGQMGMSAEEADLTIKTLGNPEALEQKMTTAMAQNAAKNVREQIIEKYGIYGQVKLFGKAAVAPLKELGMGMGRVVDEMTTGINRWYEQDFLGISPVATLQPTEASQISNFLTTEGKIMPGAEQTDAMKKLFNRVLNETTSLTGLTAVPTGEAPKDLGMTLIGTKDGKDYYAPDHRVKLELGLTNTETMNLDMITKYNGEKLFDYVNALKPEAASRWAMSEPSKDVLQLTTGMLFAKSVDRSTAEALLKEANRYKVGTEAVTDKLPAEVEQHIAGNDKLLDRTVQQINRNKDTTTLDSVVKDIVLRDEDISKYLGEESLQKWNQINSDISKTSEEPDSPERTRRLDDLNKQKAAFVDSTKFTDLSKFGQQVSAATAKYFPKASKELMTTLEANTGLQNLKESSLGKLQQDLSDKRTELKDKFETFLTKGVSSSGAFHEGISSTELAGALAADTELQGMWVDYMSGNIDPKDKDRQKMKILERMENTAAGLSMGGKHTAEFENLFTKAETYKGDFLALGKSVQELENQAHVASKGILDESASMQMHLSAANIKDKDDRQKFQDSFKFISDDKMLFARLESTEGIKDLRKNFETFNTLALSDLEISGKTSKYREAANKVLTLAERFEDSKGASSQKIISSMDSGELSELASLAGIKDTDKEKAVDVVKKKLETVEGRSTLFGTALTRSKEEAAKGEAQAATAAKGAGDTHAPEIAKAMEMIAQQTRAIGMALQEVGLYTEVLKRQNAAAH